MQPDCMYKKGTGHICQVNIPQWSNAGNIWDRDVEPKLEPLEPEGFDRPPETLEKNTLEPGPGP